MLNVEVCITQDGQNLSAGNVGMIAMRGTNVLPGYWNMREKTAEEMREDGLLIARDLGVMDPDGRISIVGRWNDLIISGGYNVYPKEVEDVLNAVNGVTETAVFGVPDADFGEQVVAAIVTNDPALDERKLKQTVATALARFKHPRHYINLGALPRNAMGNVQKVELRARYGRS